MAQQLDVLIGRVDVQPYAQVAINSSEEKFLTPATLEAQNMDLKPALGNIFWTDILAKKTEEKYVLLLDGGEYDDSAGNTLTFQGLKAALACFSYSRYLDSRTVIDTSFGAVSKASEFSDKADPKSIAVMVAKKKAVGQKYLEEVIDFLNEKSDEYDLWEKECKSKEQPYGPSVVKIRAIGRV